MKLFTLISCLMVSISPIISYKLATTRVIPKKKLFFFPASLQKPLPKEMYHGFMDELKMRYDVKVVSPQSEVDYSNETELCLLSHSSGAMQLMDTYNKIPANVPKRAIFIDPLDFKKYSWSLQVPQVPSVDLDALNDQLKDLFERDYVGDFVSSFKGQAYNKTNDKILIMNHATTNEWRYIPFMPPLSILKMDFKRMENATIKETTIEKYSHFDILDKPWATQMNKMSFQNQDTNPEEYRYEIIPQINEFYNN